MLVASAGLTACDPGDDGGGDPDATPVDPNCPLWYLDADGDHYGDAEDPGTRHCQNPGNGRVDNRADCDDRKDWVNPTEQEVCDGVDNNCDGQIEASCPLGCEPVTLTPDAATGATDYLFCKTPVLWATARTTCLQHGYDLVHIDSLAENSMLRSHATSEQMGNLFIGATDAEVEGEWIWVDDNVEFWWGFWGEGAVNPPNTATGTPYNGQWGHGYEGIYANWLDNVEPNNTGGATSAGEDCGHLTTTGAWNDTRCGDIVNAFVCERVRAAR
jgi:hypothetical protein